MPRVRKNYILFKKNGESGPVLAGSFSSMKRAKCAIKEDAVREVSKIRNRLSPAANIEYRPDGGRLRLPDQRIDYTIVNSIQDLLIDFLFTK